LLVGGDQTSDNDDTPEPNEWTPAIHQRVVDAYAKAVKDSIDSNRSLWASGNHDCEAGTYDKYDSYAGFVELMKDTCGNPLAVYRQKDDSTVSKASDPDYVKNYVMGLNYNIDGFDFIILNAPHMGDDTLSNGTIDWFDQRMKTIDKSKTVFLICHYPLNDSRGLSNSSYGLKGALMTRFKNVLKNYPNLIYLYGHNHGTTAGIPAYISSDTYQRITTYAPDGTILELRNAVPTSYISSFMGSMGYYTSKGLNAQDPSILQALMIYVYKDRIVFQMKDYSESTTKQLAPWTVMRDIEGSLDDGSSDTTDTSKPNSSTSEKPNSSTSEKPNSSTSGKPNASTSTPVGGETTDTGTPDNSTQTTDTATQSTNGGTDPGKETTDKITDTTVDSSVTSDSSSGIKPSSGTDGSSSASTDTKDSALSTGAWIGIIAGGVVLCGAAAGIAILIFKKKGKV
ncbi:MAG: metallophosphoesterase, partial [Clostridia bacterium]|nr:metallophosphoesterase [Clostridia bacterium]